MPTLTLMLGEEIKMETDISKIKKYGKEKEKENWEFRTFLKSCESKDIDAVVHKLFSEISEIIDCSDCGNCCREIRPVLKKKDITKLSKKLNITPDKFRKKYIVKDEDGDNVFNKKPCPFLNGNKCDHYDLRPTDCALYPHLHKKHFVSNLIGIIHSYSVCPIVFNVYEALKDELKPKFIEFKEEFRDYTQVSHPRIRAQRNRRSLKITFKK